MNAVIITAGGIGSRMNNNIPKQFLTTLDKPIIVYTLEAFQNHPSIDTIIVACLDGYESLLMAYAKQYQITKLENIVKGGRTGQESITNCLEKLKEFCDEDDIIMVHDGNRPLISSEIISESIATCINKGNAIAHVPCNEVILQTDNDENVENQLNRDIIKRTQTPHTFRFGKLYRAYQEILKQGKHDCVAPCSVAMTLGEKVYLSPGSVLNFKITTPEDKEIFDAIVSQKIKRR